MFFYSDPHYVTEANTSSFNLTEQERLQLISRVEKQNDADAAYRLGLYFDGAIGDPERPALWFRKALSLGKSEAKSFFENRQVILDASKNR